ncbi:MAG: thioesterase family protein [Hyphomonadaceae bacterium]|nr:thioesterase family protein [Hyphomonadaceae bacterium]MBC6412265.1 thioesterase family protein [Hyphomonadaceae bacterium]
MKNFVVAWSGIANVWECDELGHLNMRHYLGKAVQARQMFLIQLGLRDAFKPGVSSTVRLRDVHIKYIREARPGTQLHIETGLSRLDESSLQLTHIMYHHGGKVAATLIENLDHTCRRTDETFPWPNRVRETATKKLALPPDIARPKGLSGHDIMTGPNLEQLRVWGCDQVGMGIFLTEETNVFQMIAAQAYIGRLSDTNAVFYKGWPDFDAQTWHEAESTGVMLELKLSVHRSAEPSDPYHIYSGVRGVASKVRKLIHNFVNPLTGRSYATVSVVNGLIHLKERRLVAPKPEHAKILEQSVIDGLHG